MIDVNTAIEWRHALHEIAETAFGEHQTAAFVADVLRSLGLDVATGVGGTGVVGTIERGVRPIGFRADLDGLPLRERTGLSYSSRTDAMHACGHDGHMAMVLGAAATLVADPFLDRTVHFVFQPAEEPGKGAAAMIADGLFERFPMDAIYGLHNMPGTPAGRLVTRAGPIMAGEDNFTITITGRGGHASAPHVIVDPIVVAAHIVLGLQSIVSRNIDPAASAVVSCTDLVTDGARNAIPTSVRITGDARIFDPAISRQIEERMRSLAEQTARAHQARAEVVYTREFLPSVNNPTATDAAARAAAHVGQSDAQGAPVMASEDFGLYADHVPANFTFIGNGLAGQPGGVPLHSHDYDFNDALLPVGIRYYRALAAGMTVSR